MRHTAVVFAVLAASGPAVSAPMVVTIEGGGEFDTNVQRVETGPQLETSRVEAGVVRFGARLDKRARLFGGGFGVVASMLSRVVADPNVSSENVALFTGELRYLHAVDKRPVSLGAGVVAADAFGLSDEIGARTFRSLGADALLVLDASEATHLAFAFGARDFRYKENHAFDWTGPAATARLDVTLWQQSGGARSLELDVVGGFELRDYDAMALVNVCRPGGPPDASCSAGTKLPRHDRMQRIAVELTWVGAFVATAGYQLSVIDSNSYGQSVVRNKATASVTRTLVAGLYGTLLGQLQIDRYLDGLVIETDTQRSEFTSLDDENRSSLQLRIGRPVSAGWSVEARGAIWRNLGNDQDATFRRSSVYIGAIYNR